MQYLFRFFLLLPLLLPGFLLAQLGGPTGFIRLDQFGYLPHMRKVAVIADPQAGFNAAQSFSPGLNYEVRRWSDDGVVFSGALEAWNNGATHAQSGDRGWWFDFSAVTEPGSYYLYDAATGRRSYRFEIGHRVYDELLKVAGRTYYYQRLNFPHEAPFADPRWADEAAYEGPEQDRAVRSRWAKGDPATAKDLHGGWMDAGDPNKYTTFAEGAMVNLLEAFATRPEVFPDDWDLPESGNGRPDLVDELVWQLDWLKRMQDATGTGGLFLKVGVDNHNSVTPLSLDTRPRYYLPECTSATLAGAHMFAKAAQVLQRVSGLEGYAADLQSRAIAAWERGRVSTQAFSSFETNCDDQDITSGDADRSEQEQLESALAAAVYLFALTDSSVYQDFVENNYPQVRPYVENWWGPYRSHVAIALLFYSQLPAANAQHTTAIRNQKANMDYQYSIDSYEAGTDLYRAFLDDWAYHWGSNQVRAEAGNQNLNNLVYGLNIDRHGRYRETAAGYLHSLHGVNPLGMVYLSNMYEHGAEFSANEIYHTWFADGSGYDHALNSPLGPAPGYLTGGPNAAYGGTVSPPANEPPQKAYLDWNSGWPENSWEITEPAIYYQAAYLRLLSFLAGDTVLTALSPPKATLDLQVYPNPGHAEVWLSLSRPGPYHWALYDLQGQQIGAEEAFFSQGKPVDIMLPQLQRGTYLLRVRGAEGVAWTRLQRTP